MHCNGIVSSQLVTTDVLVENMIRNRTRPVKVCTGQEGSKLRVTELINEDKHLAGKKVDTPTEYSVRSVGQNVHIVSYQRTPRSSPARLRQKPDRQESQNNGKDVFENSAKRKQNIMAENLDSSSDEILCENDIEDNSGNNNNDDKMAISSDHDASDRKKLTKRIRLDTMVILPDKDTENDVSDEVTMVDDNEHSFGTN